MKVSRICPVCGSDYQADTNRLKWGRETTCSRACSYKFRADQRRKSITVTCAVCGKEFDRPPSHIKSKHSAVYCSAACQYKGRSLGLTKRIVTEPYEISEAGRIAQKKATKRRIQTRIANGYRHSKATRRKLREATAKNIADGKIKRVSKIEHIVAKELRAIGIKFIHQFKLRNELGQIAACPDFWLPDFNAVVEVNGTFWHADPRFYDHSDLTPAQRRTIERYARKVNLLKQLGIRLIEIWEADIKESASDAVANALAPVVG